MSYTIRQPKTEEEFKQYASAALETAARTMGPAEGSEVDDMEEQCFHVMAMDDEGQVIGIARLQFNSVSEVQIRYMAVTDDYTRQGIGRALINILEQHAKKSSHNKIILHAREPAVDFYKKLGYELIEKSYLLFDEIQHFRMSKTL